MKIFVRPISLAEANAFVDRLHRHHKSTQGHKFSIAAEFAGKVVGVAIVGRPVSRHRDDGFTAEVTRLCTDGTPNACSLLYAASAKAAFAMGYTRIGTYTLATENGASLRGSGWQFVRVAGGGDWNCKSRPREGTEDHLQVKKHLWEKTAKCRVGTDFCWDTLI